MYWHFVVGGDLVEKRKPAPDSINYAVELNNAEEGSHFYLGDNDTDIFAARDSKYQVASIGGIWGAEHPDRLRASEPDHLFQSVSDYTQWFISSHYSKFE